MSVQNIECQIAKAQLGRYLAGEKMDGEVVHQLEAHVASCPECKGEMTERRAKLLASLGREAEVAEASVFQTAVAAESKAADNLIQALQRQQAAAEAKRAAEPAPVATAVVAAPMKGPAFWKPIAYSVGLGAVLIAMSFLGKGGTGILGDKVADAIPAKSTTEKAPAKSGAAPLTLTPTKPTPEAVSKPATDTAATTGNTDTPTDTAATTPQPVTTKPTAAEETPAAVEKPVAKEEVKKVPTPVVETPKAATPRPATLRPPTKVVVKKAIVAKPVIKPRVRQTTRRTTPRRATATRKATAQKVVTKKPAGHGIRVYDANGNPIK